MQSGIRTDTLWYFVKLVVGNAELAEGRSHYTHTFIAEHSVVSISFERRSGTMSQNGTVWLIWGTLCRVYTEHLFCLLELHADTPQIQI